MINKIWYLQTSCRLHTLDCRIVKYTRRSYNRQIFIQHSITICKALYSVLFHEVTPQSDLSLIMY